MVFRPPFIKQLDGTQYAGFNCTLASGCMAAIRHRLGLDPAGSAMWYPKPWYLRLKLGDKSGGTNLIQLDSILNRLYRIDLEVSWGDTWDEFRENIRFGRGAVLQGGYSAIQHTIWSGSTSFGGNHAIYINEIRYNYRLARWEYLVYDPLADGRRNLDKGPSWIPEYILVTFAARLLIDQNTITGRNNVWAAYTRDTEPPVRLDAGATVYPKGPRRFFARVNGARVRADASRHDKVIVSLDRNDPFLVYQRKKGEVVSGSAIWYGNRTGTAWIHSSVVKTSR